MSRIKKKKKKGGCFQFSRTAPFFFFRLWDLPPPGVSPRQGSILREPFSRPQDEAAEAGAAEAWARAWAWA